MSKFFLGQDPLTFISLLTEFLSQTPTFFFLPPTSKHFESPAIGSLAVKSCATKKLLLLGGTGHKKLWVLSGELPNGLLFEIAAGFIH